MRKPAFCICENKDADQLRGNRKADQRLCFRYTDSTIPLLPESEISSLSPSSVTVQPGLCGTWSETPKTGFLTRLICKNQVFSYCDSCISPDSTRVIQNWEMMKISDTLSQNYGSMFSVCKLVVLYYHYWIDSLIGDDPHTKK